MTWLTQVLAAFSKPFKWWVVVAPWERGIRIRLGKVARLLKPGIHGRVPFLDRIYVQSVRLRIISTSNQTVATKDGKVLTISFAVRFAISDIVKLYESIAHPENTLLGEVLSLAARYISARDSALVSPSAVERYVSARLYGERWGLGGLGVNVTSFAYVRTYRILMHDYERISNMDLESQDRAGER